MKPSILLLGLVALTPLATAQTSTSFENAFGKKYHLSNFERNGPPDQGLDAIHRWNRIAIDASGLDHTPPYPGESRVFGEQLGPCRSSRAIAIVQIAVYDAVMAIYGTGQSYTSPPKAEGPISLDAAIAQAAHDTLTALYPSQERTFETRLNEDLSAVDDPVARAAGIALGQRVASAMLAQRENDGAEIPEPLLGIGHITDTQPGHWRQDPVSQVPVALGAHWSECRPFVLNSTSQFRVPAPPALNTGAYTAAYNEAKRLGGDGVVTPTDRTPEETFIGTFWAYDGTPSLCAPPRLYNQILIHVADQTQLNTTQLARLLAIANTAMADAGMAAWDSKFYWDFWRPVTGIRESDVGTGPSGLGDGNPATVGDPNYLPLGAPASNLTGPNFTPPFPTYPSGHATFGGALFQVLRRFYGTDQFSFTFVSDEFNGVTIDNHGHVRPFIPRSFTSFSQAEIENGRSRVYLGIHWNFDSTAGITLGRQVGNYVFDHAFQSAQNFTPVELRKRN